MGKKRRIFFVFSFIFFIYLFFSKKGMWMPGCKPSLWPRPVIWPLEPSTWTKVSGCVGCGCSCNCSRVRQMIGTNFFFLPSLSIIIIFTIFTIMNIIIFFSFIFFSVCCGCQTRVGWIYCLPSFPSINKQIKEKEKGEGGRREKGSD